jgi:hypothetical protein
MPRSYSYDLRTRVIKDVNAKMAIQLQRLVKNIVLIEILFMNGNAYKQKAEILKQRFVVGLKGNGVKFKI